jgi:hypothetical protein
MNGLCTIERVIDRFFSVEMNGLFLHYVFLHRQLLDETCGFSCDFSFIAPPPDCLSIFFSAEALLSARLHEPEADDEIAHKSSPAGPQKAVSDEEEPDNKASNLVARTRRDNVAQL